MTNGASSDAPQLRHILRQCNWVKVDIILGDRGYASRECFNEIIRYGSKPGIPVRKNATIKARGCSSRKKAVRFQRENYEDWKEKIQYTMRCVI